MLLVKFAFLMELRTNVEDSEWMNECLHSVCFIGRFSFCFCFFIFSPERDHVLWQVSADCNSLLTYIVHNIHVEQRNSLFWPGFCFAQLDLNLQHTYLIRYDLRGYSGFFTQIPSVFHTSRSHPKFFPIGFSTVNVADIPTYCPEIESFSGS